MLNRQGFSLKDGEAQPDAFGSQGMTSNEQSWFQVNDKSHIKYLQEVKLVEQIEYFNAAKANRLRFHNNKWSNSCTGSDNLSYYVHESLLAFTAKYGIPTNQ